MTEHEGCLSLNEAAEKLGVHYMTAYRYVRTGRLPAVQHGSHWLVDPADLARLSRAAPARRGRSAGARAVGQGRGVERSATMKDRMVAGDEAGTWGIVEGAIASGMEPADVYGALLTPALRDIGDGWLAGDVSVADEHRASAVAQRVVGRLGPRFARRGRKRGSVVLGSPAGDLHSLPCSMLADLLRGAGFDVADIGANAPAESFLETAMAADRLVAVLVGASAPNPDVAVRETVAALHQADLGVPVLVGGRAISDAEHALRLGADGWSGADGATAVAAVERIAAQRRSR